MSSIFSKKNKTERTIDNMASLSYINGNTNLSNIYIIKYIDNIFFYW